jgi:periplasmic protein TonB
MNQPGYFETGHQFSPTTLTMIVALHAAAIATAAAWKMQVIPFKSPPIKVWLLPQPRDPDPIPVTPDAKTPPKVRQIPIVPKPETQPQSEEANNWSQLLGGTTAVGTHVEPEVPVLPTKLEPARARGDVRFLFSPNDYPEAARRRDETGTVRARLDISANGSVTGCSIVASSGSAALDSATCRVLKARAHFAPAKDSSGQAVNDSYLTPKIVWKIEGDG